jgi:ElaA protein
MSPIDVDWHFLAFEALMNGQLYAVLQLRSEVFVVEQRCLFLDMDGADADAMHLLGMRQGRLVAYARCLAAGVSYPQASLGRILTHKSVRGTGVGHALVEEALACLERQWGAQPIRIGAQAHLEAFYRQHGFLKTGPLYLEDGIPHLEMLRACGQPGLASVNK